MRFLRMFGRYLVGGGLLLAVATLLVMFGLSYFQVAKVVKLTLSAKQLTKRPAHVTQCMVNQNDEEYPLKGYQIRFLDATNYVMEAVCASVVRGPFEIAKGKLDFGVKKTSGYAGILFPSTTETGGEGVMVFEFGYARWIVKAGSQPRTQVIPALVQSKALSEPAGSWAATATCEGWGYACCNQLTQVGEGQTVAGNIMSCADSCYQRCLERPSILIFTSDPQPEAKSRILNLRRGELVVFSYGIQDVDSEGVSVQIAYGDGDSAESTNQADEFSHVYNCGTEFCSYTATLSARDSEGLDNSRTRISTLTVNVR